MAATIKFKRGSSDNTGTLAAGEPAFNTSDSKFFIGTNGTNKTWVGAEIENSVTWSSASISKLATQSAIKTYVDGDGSANIKALNINTDGTYYPVFISASGSATAANVDTSHFTWNPSSNTLGVSTTSITGSGLTTSASAVTISGTSTSGTSTLNLGNNATAASATLTINLGTGGAATATTNVIYGSNNLGSFTSNNEIIVANKRSLRFNQTDNVKYVGITAPSSITSASYTITLPSAAPSANNQVLAVLDSGAGTTTWATPSSTATTVTVENLTSDDGALGSTVYYPPFYDSAAAGRTTYIDTEGYTYIPGRNRLRISSRKLTDESGDWQTCDGVGSCMAAYDGPAGNTSTWGTGSLEFTNVNESNVRNGAFTFAVNAEETAVATFVLPTNADAAVGKVLKIKQHPTTNNLQLYDNELFNGANSPVYFLEWADETTPAGVSCTEESTTNAERTLLFINPDQAETGKSLFYDNGTSDTAKLTYNPSLSRISTGGLSLEGDASPQIQYSTAGTNVNVFSTTTGTVTVGGGAVNLGGSGSVVTVNGDLAVNGATNAEITTTTAAASVFNSNATTISAFGAGTNITIGASSGTTTTIRGGTLVGNTTTQNVFNSAATTVNAFGAATTLSIGASSGTATINNASTVVTGDLTVNGGNIVGPSASTLSIDPNATQNLVLGGTWTNSTQVVQLGSSGQYKITNVKTPTTDYDAANKLYVDTVAQGLHVHATAAAATTAKLATLIGAGTSLQFNAGSGTITWSGGNALNSAFTDGVTLIVNATEASASRILVKNEGDSGGLGAQYNGLWYASNVRELTRVADGNTAAEWVGGDFVFVQQGTVYNNTGWVQTETVATINSTPILFEQFSGAGTYDGDGTTITKTGNIFSISAGYVGQTSITTLGTIATGVWQGTDVGLGHGGTNATLSATPGAIVYGSSDGMAFSAVGTAGSVLTSGNTGAPTWTAQSSITAGTATSVTNTANNTDSDWRMVFTDTPAGAAEGSTTEFRSATSNGNYTGVFFNPNDVEYSLGSTNVGSTAVLSVKWSSTVQGYLDAIVDGGTY